MSGSLLMFRPDGENQNQDKDEIEDDSKVIRRLNNVNSTPDECPRIVDGLK